MVAVEVPVEVLYVQPGALYAGRRPLRLRTFLGSCVALSAWHPETRMAALCHFVLPTSPHGTASRDCDGRYGGDALAFMLVATRATDPRLNHFRWGIFGGASVLGTIAHDASTGMRNLALAWAWLFEQGVQPVHVDVAGGGSRLLQLDTQSGATHVRYVARPDDRGRELRRTRSLK